MSKTITLPPADRPRSDGIRLGGWWHEVEDGRRIACDLCPRACKLAPGDRGFCFVRQNRDGQMVSTTYGRSTGFCIDPIEKKPLNQFYPGTSVLSFGTAGCNLGCKFCQNWTSSKSREVDDYCDTADPESVAEAARHHGCRSVAFTYNDPVVWAEYAIATARACRAAGIKTVAVTAGYITPLARPAFFEWMDAANVDLKGFSESFYWKLASGHLDPVRDTLRWLVHETDVWVEITNLIIPQANDSDDELRRMCDWVLEELGPEVPLHFSAFHPDFRLRDRGPTPPETLLRAYQIAQAAGLKYVYTGNVSQSAQQSTYCPGCGRMVIGRDGYQLGLYALDHHRCKHCGQSVAGHYDAQPGSWGARRLPVRIAAFQSKAPKRGGEPRMDQSSASARTARPQLDPQQEQQLFAATGERVAAVVRAQTPAPLAPRLGPIAQSPVFGAFVSLKRGGQLRSCCGFLGQSAPLAEAIEHAAVRAAKDDPRFPPISPVELEHLDMEVWLLWGMEEVPQRGLDRIQAVEIGKHGLQIARGAHRGLLLPGVAVEHGFSAEEFLKHVCLKAGLPPLAWKDNDTVLMRFEGYAIRGKLNPGPAPEREGTRGGPSPVELASLADFARQNLVALTVGLTPSFYLPGGFDGSVHGLSLSARLPDSTQEIGCSRLSTIGQMPLQATLFELVKTLAQALQSQGVGSRALGTLRAGLSIFWDPASQGTVAQPGLEGFDPSRRALVVSDRARWSCVYDPAQPAEALLAAAVEQYRSVAVQQAEIYSLAVASTESRLSVTNAPRPQAGPGLRRPAVAGRFYPADPAEIAKMLDGFLPEPRQTEAWGAALVPHAGWVYSGRLAAEVLGRVKIPSRVIVVAPKHHAQGADWALAPHRGWCLPGGELAGDRDLAERLARSVTGLELDALAHQMEHAIEVQLPILARLAPKSQVLGIAIHGGSLDQLDVFARQMADSLRELPEPPLLVISSDMNHYASDAETRRVDRLALDALERMDPEALYETVRQQRISMCGVLPAVLVLKTLRHLGGLNRCRTVGYTTSAEASGDTQRVVGYAGMLFA